MNWGLRGILARLQTILTPHRSHADEQSTLVDRSPRVIPGGYQSTRLDLLSASGWKSVPIVNLSTSGVGAEDVLKRDFALGQNVEAKVTLGQKVFSLSLEVRHRTAGVLGLKITDPAPDYQTALVSHFRRELAASQMVRVPEHLQKKPAFGQPLWFRASDIAELYVVRDAAKILSFQLSFFGHLFEGEASGPVQYGHVLASAKSANKYKESDLVRWESQVPLEVVEMAMNVVTNIIGLERPLQEALVVRLESALLRREKHSTVDGDG